MMAREDLARLNTALQAELVAIKAETTATTTAKVASLEDTITNLAHEIAVLKRRLFGNKTERSHASEAQLALGDLLAAEAQLQRQLDAAIERAKDAIDPEPAPKPPGGPDDGVKAMPRGRRDLRTSKLPRCSVEILDHDLEAPVGLQGLLRIRAIYAAERVVRCAPAVERKTLRDQHVRPLIDEFFAWVPAARSTTPGRNRATKALGYASNQEVELRRVLDDVNLPLDNTRAERALRKIVVGRKSWMFYGSDTHAEAAAAIFSVIASCRLHRLDPHQYLEEVLRVLPYWPSDRYLELSPKYWPVTRGRLNPKELAAPLSSFEIPPPPGEPIEPPVAPSG